MITRHAINEIALPVTAQCIFSYFISGPHNGTIYNAPHISKMYGLNRFAGVDSEVIFIVANKFRNPIQFKSKLKDFRGQITAVMVNLNSPEKIRIYKGNKPFAMMWLDELNEMIYASNEDYFGSVEAGRFTVHDTHSNRIE